MKRGLLLREIRVDPARGGQRIERLPFLSHGPVEIELRSPLTLLIGENGSGKTTLLEADRRALCHPARRRGAAMPRPKMTASRPRSRTAVDVTFGGRRPKGLFLRADRFAEDHGPRGPAPHGDDRRMAAWPMSRAAAKACSRC